MNINKSITIALTGHRSNRISNADLLAEDIFHHLHDFYFRGYRTFLTGMAEGFDLLAAEAVLKLRTIHADVRLVAVIPFTRQAYRFSKEDQRRYGEIFKACDDSVLISERYYTGCFHRRNDYLIAHASQMVAYFDGRAKGGTYYTVQRAIKNGIPVQNLFDDQQIHQWWNGLENESKILFSGEESNNSNRVFWRNLHPCDRDNIHRWWQSVTGAISLPEDEAHELWMEVVCELVELTMEREFTVSREEMYDADGSYYEKYQDRFNDLYDEIEDRLLNFNS